MHGIKRVLVFCTLIVILPATLIVIPLYLRNIVFADVTYPVAESDIIEIRDGISSIFCRQHSLRMSTSFNAFQLHSKPSISTSRKHIRLKKSMTLPDDTLEYWGFYLLKGALVYLKFCSRYDGSRILVVKGERELHTCGLLDHNKNKMGAHLAQGHEQVKVFFEDITEIAVNVAANEIGRHPPDTDTDTDTNTNTDQHMERENSGGEDLSDDDRTAATTRSPRKKLKKGSVDRLRHTKSEDAGGASGNSVQTAPKELDLLQKLTSNRTKEAASRQRRHYSHLATNVTDAAGGGSVGLPHRVAYDRRRQEVYDLLYKRRTKRNEHVYDRKYSHGGNAVNFTETDESNSVSSFENGLFECFNGAILLAEGFPPTAECTSTHFLENGSHRMLSKHEITEDGYYYYIFYSDNDLVRNDIHAIFDIYKPTFQYSNLTDAQGCIGATNCTFPISFLSDAIVVVEVPTRDGIEHEEDDITYLISTCHPRHEVYAIFPILVLILILSCSFL